MPRDVKREAARLLAPALQLPEEELYKDFSREGEYVRIKRMLEPKASDAVAQIIKDNKLPGLYFEQEKQTVLYQEVYGRPGFGFRRRG